MSTNYNKNQNLIYLKVYDKLKPDLRMYWKESLNRSFFHDDSLRGITNQTDNHLNWNLMNLKE